MPSLRIVEGADAARSSVLQRDPFGAPELPEAVQQSIEELWGESLSAAAHVARILEAVATEGDEAVTRLSQRFDGSSYDRIEVSAEEISEAFSLVPAEQIDAIEFAANRVRQYHREQLRHAPQSFDGRGAGMLVRPLQRVGIYMTGSDAALPSSVIHTAVPGVVAGVDEVIGVTAAQADGTVNPVKLVAARFAGISRIFRASGAQAIGALAYGTETIAAVDKIVGPGNAWVAAAKRQVFGTVGIDMVAGPSEILVVADGANDPDWIAVDLLAQAEHDEAAQSILITDDEAFAARVEAAVEARLKTLPRAAIAGASWAAFGAVIVVDDLGEAPALVDALAPEHLELAVADPEPLAEAVNHAGAIFMGRFTPEAVGDYVAGTNHVLPTSGTARFSSGLSVLDFVKRTSIIACDADSLGAIGPAAVTLAQAEGLDAHALSIAIRLNLPHPG